MLFMEYSCEILSCINLQLRIEYTKRINIFFLPEGKLIFFYAKLLIFSLTTSIPLINKEELISQQLTQMFTFHLMRSIPRQPP